GLHVLWFYSEDVLGHKEEIKITTVAVDNTPPATTIAFGQPSFVAGPVAVITGQTAISVTAVDSPLGNAAASGVQKIEFSIDSGPLKVYNEPFFILDQGTHTITYYSTDNLGNAEASRLAAVSVTPFKLNALSSLDNVRLSGESGIWGNVQANDAYVGTGNSLVDGDVTAAAIVVKGNAKILGKITIASNTLMPDPIDMALILNDLKSRNNNDQIPPGFLDKKGVLRINDHDVLTLSSGTYHLGGIVQSGQSRLVFSGPTELLVDGFFDPKDFSPDGQDNNDDADCDHDEKDDNWVQWQSSTRSCAATADTGHKLPYAPGSPPLAELGGTAGPPEAGTPARVKVSGKSQWQLNGSVTLYVQGTASFGGQAWVNSQGNPQELVILAENPSRLDHPHPPLSPQGRGEKNDWEISGRLGAKVMVSGKASLFATVYAPDSHLWMTGDSLTYGHVFAKSFIMTGQSRLIQGGLAIPPEPKTIKVPKDYPTLQAAVDAANPGDMINIGPGNFCGAYISKRLEIVGTKGQYPLTLPSPPRGEGGGEGVVIIGCPAPAPFHPSGFRVGLWLSSSAASGTTIKNITFDGKGVSNMNLKPLGMAIQARDLNNGNAKINYVTVENNTIIGTIQGITNNAGDNWNIRNNTIKNLSVFDCVTGARFCGGGVGIVSQVWRGDVQAGQPMSRPFNTTIVQNDVSGKIPDTLTLFSMVGIWALSLDQALIVNNKMTIPDNPNTSAGGVGIWVANTCCGSPAGSPVSAQGSDYAWPPSINVQVTKNDGSDSEFAIIIDSGNTTGLVLKDNKGLIIVGDEVVQDPKKRQRRKIASYDVLAQTKSSSNEEQLSWQTPSISAIVPKDAVFVDDLVTVLVRADYGRTSTLAMLLADPAFKMGEAYCFPNPATGSQKPTFHIETGLADKVELRIYDISGELIHETTLDVPPQVIDDGQGPQYAYEYPWDASRVGSGVYVYVIQSFKAGEGTLKKMGKCALVK
ncbi:MAG: T9SS type A sorting domain-containing protein, partial [Elusimicrobia bacterium]|nr:T9SS type A sorting domain-containing protein [Elusimicrobiota bacterium]